MFLLVIEMTGILSFNTVKGIGELKYKNIYGFYDEPLMFSCFSATGSLYFLLRLPCDDEQWLAVEVSKERLELLENNCMEIRVPFLSPESGYLYRFYREHLGIEYEILTPVQLADEILPYSGEYLDYHNEAGEIEHLGYTAARENSTVVEIYDGELKGIDMEKNQFTFVSFEDVGGERISGKISPDLFNRSFTVPSKTSVKVETTINFDKVSGNERYAFTLLDVG